MQFAKKAFSQEYVSRLEETINKLGILNPYPVSCSKLGIRALLDNEVHYFDEETGEEVPGKIIPTELRMDLLLSLFKLSTRRMRY